MAVRQLESLTTPALVNIRATQVDKCSLAPAYTTPCPGADIITALCPHDVGHHVSLYGAQHDTSTLTMRCSVSCSLRLMSPEQSPSLGWFPQRKQFPISIARHATTFDQVIADRSLKKSTLLQLQYVLRGCPPPLRRLNQLPDFDEIRYERYATAGYHRTILPDVLHS
jgi:hypothetical protein